MEKEKKHSHIRNVLVLCIVEQDSAINLSG